MRWLSKRSAELPPIHGIAAYERNSRVTRSFALRIPQGCRCIVVDTAAAIEAQSMPEVTRDAHAVLVPVLPSDIDIHAAAKCITDLLLVAKIPREQQRIGVIANRVKKNTVMYRSLMRFLGTLEIPIITTLRDSQNYVRAAESGIGLFEMKPYLVREDWDQWRPLIGWLAQRDGLGMQSLPAMPIMPPLNRIAPIQQSSPQSSLATSIPILPPAIPMPRRPMYVAPKSAPLQESPQATIDSKRGVDSSMKTSLPDFLRFVGGDS